MEDLGVDWRFNIKMDFKKIGWEAWIGLMWLRIGTSGGDGTASRCSQLQCETSHC